MVLLITFQKFAVQLNKMSYMGGALARENLQRDKQQQLQQHQQQQRLRDSDMLKKQPNQASILEIT